MINLTEVEEAGDGDVAVTNRPVRNSLPLLSESEIAKLGAPVLSNWVTHWSLSWSCTSNDSGTRFCDIVERRGLPMMRTNIRPRSPGAPLL